MILCVIYGISDISCFSDLSALVISPCVRAYCRICCVVSSVADFVSVFVSTAVVVLVSAFSLVSAFLFMFGRMILKLLLVVVIVGCSIFPS